MATEQYYNKRVVNTHKSKPHISIDYCELMSDENKRTPKILLIKGYSIYIRPILFGKTRERIGK